MFVYCIQNMLMNEYNHDVDSLNYVIQNDGEPETYIMHSRMCKRLSREFSQNEMKFYEEEEDPYDENEQREKYIQPLTHHGLENSEIIIRSYYKLHENPSNIMNFDYYHLILDDIRNCRHLYQ